MAEGTTTTNVRITGVDMTLGDLTVLFLKIGIALLPVIFLLMFVSWVFTVLFASTMLPGSVVR
jgi:hypothetical protein